MEEEYHVHRYTSDALVRRIRARAPSRPRLDRKTSIEGPLDISVRGHRYSVAFMVSIKPVSQPPHTHFECEHIRLSFCCSPNLDEELVTKEALKKIQKLLYVDYPQVVCSVGEIER
jgi:hypothetical protein